MSKSGFILTILAALITCGYNINSLSGKGTAVKVPAGTPPVIEPSPVITFAKPGNDAMAKIEVWNLKPFVAKGPAGMPSLKDMFKPYYTISKTGRFESISRGAAANDRWEFQGVLTEGGSLRAIFYNPSQPGRKTKILARGGAVEPGLLVKEISKNKVILHLAGEKKPRDFELRIFNSNRENYANKRKVL